jgi:hypothetical protein
MWHASEPPENQCVRRSIKLEVRLNLIVQMRNVLTAIYIKSHFHDPDNLYEEGRLPAGV